MIDGDVEVLNRAHQLFAARLQPVSLDAGLDRYVDLLERSAQWETGPGHDRYRRAVLAQRDRLAANARTDAAATAVLAAVVADHARAGQQTGGVVAAARADAAVDPDTPLAQREAMRRRAAQLRAQRATCCRPDAAHRRIRRGCDGSATARGTGCRARIGCGYQTLAPERRFAPRCRGWEGPMSGAPPGRTDSTARG